MKTTTTGSGNVARQGEVMSDGSGMALCTERTREHPDDL